MKFLILSALVALAAARPDGAYRFNTETGDGIVRSAADDIPILRSDVIAAIADGEYSFDTKTDDDIRRSAADDIPILRSDVIAPSADGEYSFNTKNCEGIVHSGRRLVPMEDQGTDAFTPPDGQDFELNFGAAADGMQKPESRCLP